MKNEINQNEIKNIGGTIGYDNNGNTYSRDITKNSKNERQMGKWELNNNMGCSGKSMEYFEKENKKYIEIQKMCGFQ